MDILDNWRENCEKWGLEMKPVAKTHIQENVSRFEVATWLRPTLLRRCRFGIHLLFVNLVHLARGGGGRRRERKSTVSILQRWQRRIFLNVFSFGNSVYDPRSLIEITPNTRVAPTDQPKTSALPTLSQKSLPREAVLGSEIFIVWGLRCPCKHLGE